MKKIYLILAFVGAVAPYYFFIDFIVERGFIISEFIFELFANSPASGFTTDLLISSIVFWVFMFYDKKENKNLNPLIFIMLNLFIGLSCALPAYLYARTKK